MLNCGVKTRYNHPDFGDRGKRGVAVAVADPQYNFHILKVYVMNFTVIFVCSIINNVYLQNKVQGKCTIQYCFTCFFSLVSFRLVFAYRKD